MTSVRRLAVAATAIWCFVLTPVHPAAQPASGRLTIDTLIDIKHPSSPVWSPDSRQVAFVWERAGVQNVWVADASTAPASPRALTRYDSGTLGGLFWSHDGRHLYYSRDGDLWTVDPDGAQPPHAVWPTPLHGGNVVVSPDGAAVAFVRGGDV